MAETIVWYDLETFGTDPRFDRIAQFAGIRTTPQLETIPGQASDSTTLWCKPTKDYLPDPKSCLITGIGPFYCHTHGLNEHDFFGAIYRILSESQTCTAGFNTIRFDDEFVRFGFYRNLRDPYLREYANDNSRWDLLDVFRAARDLRPEGILWPVDADGKSSFRLEALTAANGISHENAHDALSDVRATIDLARLLRSKQTRFFDWCYKNRTKQAVKKHINLHTRVPFVHTSGMFTGPRGCTSLVAPLAPDPANQNAILCYDLRYDPSDLIKMDVEVVRKRLFLKNEELQAQGLERIHIKAVHLNRSPFVAPVKILEEADTAERLGININQCRKHWQKLQSDPKLIQKIIKIYDRKDDFAGDTDSDMSLYGGFVSDSDRTRLNAVLYQAEQDTTLLPSLSARLSFEHRKLPEMVYRFIARNFPETLSPQEGERWKSFCAARLLMPPGERLVNLDFYERKIAEHMADTSIPARSKVVLADLSEWSRYLKHEVLSY